MGQKLYEECNIRAVADALRLKNDGAADTFTTEQMKNAVLGLGFSNVPDYHFAEAGRLVKNLLSWKETHPNSLIFGAISDSHYSAADSKAMTSARHASFALETVGAMACDFIANLGDNCAESYMDPTLPQYSGADGLAHSKAMLDCTRCGFDRLMSFRLVGNHDKSNDTQQVYDLNGAFNDYDGWGYTKIRGFGYKDLTDKKVRVICLNSADYLNAAGGNGMSYDQKDFLMRALDLSGKSDGASWQILLLSHIPLDFTGGDYNTFADLQTILTAYENGTTATITVNSSYALNETPSNYPTYFAGNLVYNYAGKNSARIIGNIHGHIHNNKTGKIANTNIVRVSTANSNWGNKSESYPDNGDYGIDSIEAAKIAKVADSVKDTSATFYAIDLNEQTVYCFGYGADIDRTVIYKSANVYSVAYSLTDATSSNKANSIVEGKSYITTISAATVGWSMEGVVVTMGGVDVTGTVYHAATGEIRIEEVTGDIVITAKAKAPYTNVIDSAGTEDGVRLRSGGATGEAAGFASNYFACKQGDVIRVYFPNGARTSIPSNGVYACEYSDNAGTMTAVYDASNTNVVTVLSDNGYKWTVKTAACSYARVAGGANGQYAGWIVTVNETIPQASELN